MQKDCPSRLDKSLRLGPQNTKGSLPFVQPWRRVTYGMVNVLHCMIQAAIAEISMQDNLG
jgi:hypothetical protein